MAVVDDMEGQVGGVVADAEVADFVDDEDGGPEVGLEDGAEAAGAGDPSRAARGKGARPADTSGARPPQAPICQAPTRSRIPQRDPSRAAVRIPPVALATCCSTGIS